MDVKDSAPWERAKVQNCDMLLIMGAEDGLAEIGLKNNDLAKPPGAASCDRSA